MSLFSWKKIQECKEAAIQRNEAAERAAKAAELPACWSMAERDKFVSSVSSCLTNKILTNITHGTSFSVYLDQNHEHDDFDKERELLHHNDKAVELIFSRVLDSVLEKFSTDDFPPLEFSVDTYEGSVGFHAEIGEEADNYAPVYVRVSDTRSGGHTKKRDVFIRAPLKKRQSVKVDVAVSGAADVKIIDLTPGEDQGFFSRIFGGNKR